MTFSKPCRSVLRLAASGVTLAALCAGCLVASSFSAPSAVAADKAPQSLAEQLPRIPPVAPAKALATFALEHGFKLELVASEPLVSSPVDACFDENGRIYVAEMRDYPFSWEPTKLNPKGGGKKDAGVIRLLVDADGDGRADRATVFADKLTWPTSVCCYQGGVFVLAPPRLHYFKDTDGDGVADVRKVVLTGFNRDNVQAIANNLKWSLENRIVFASGRNGGNLERDGRRVFSIHGQDISLDPSTFELSPMTGGEQFGLSFDDWGNRFVCNNSNHIEQVVFEDRYVGRNPYFAVPGTIRTIGVEGPAAPVFRRSPPEPWRVVRTRRRVSDPVMMRTLPHTEQFAVGYFTSAAGVTIYRGDAYPPAFRGNAFIGDVGGNLVHRKILSRDGAALTARRADEHVEFLASTDNWFRPVNFANGPDGCLYIVDMYRETIEHPYSIPDDIKAHLDLESGDRGRIYRLVAPGMVRTRPARLGGMSSVDLVLQLESDNGWTRETAQRLLWERQDPSVVPALDDLARLSKKPLGRLHALYALAGLSALSDSTVSTALRDGEPRVRAHAIRLAESRLRRSPSLLTAVAGLADDPDGLVRFQLALSLGEADAERTIEPLARLGRHAAADPLLRSAMLTSVSANSDRVAARLLEDQKFLGRSGAVPLLVELAAITGAQPDLARSRALFKEVVAAKAPGIQVAVLRALGEGLARRRASISALFDRGDADAALRQAAADLFKQAAEVAADESRPTARRAEAIGLLALAPYRQAAPVLTGLLAPQTPVELQSAAVAALSSQGDPDVAARLLAGWKNLGPVLRHEVIDGLTRSPQRIDELLSAIDAGRVGRGEVDRDVKQNLTTHPNLNVRRRARRVFEADLPGNRRKVVADYQAALERNGSVEQGRAVYEQRCSSCHRAGNRGHAVGPDLVSVQNKSPADLLVAILDPNREAQPNYVAYNVVTNQGTVHNGIISAETAGALTLRRSEGKEDQILRSQIESLTSTGKSLMPEGFEKDIPVDRMADLIAYLKTIRPAAAR